MTREGIYYIATISRPDDRLFRTITSIVPAHKSDSFGKQLVPAYHFTPTKKRQMLEPEAVLRRHEG
jgi:hypothetical protein